MLRILLGASVVSLVIGILHDGLANGWIEGTAIFFAVFVVVSITSFNNWSKEKQFTALNRENQNKNVAVKRDHKKLKEISVNDLLVGDILNLAIGQVVPVDGIIINGSVSMDESAMTGESEIYKKTYGTQNSDPFIMSGTQVVNGQGQMIVCAIGRNSLMGKSREVMSGESDKTALETKLEKLADMIGNLGFLAAIFIGCIILLKAIIMKIMHGQSLFSSDIIDALVNAFLISVTVIVVAIPEGLPMAVTISLAYSVKKMKEEHNLVRHLEASEIMGNVNNVCTDKTGTLTEGKMSLRNIFVGDYDFKLVRNSDDEKMNTKLQDIFLRSVINSKNESTIIQRVEGKLVATGNFTECAIIQYVIDNKLYTEELKEKNGLLGLLPFKSDYKFEAHIYKKNGENNYKLYVKGAPEIVFQYCTQYLNKVGDFANFNDFAKKNFMDKQEEYADSAMRTLVIAFRDIPAKEFDNANKQNEPLSFQFFLSVMKDLKITAMLGIADAPRPDVKGAITSCKDAGILVRMVTGDNINTAIAISRDVGILTADEARMAKIRVKCLDDRSLPQQEDENCILAMEGREFRKVTGGYRRIESTGGEGEDNNNAFELVSQHLFEKYTKHLKVIARASPEDKFLLVLGLKTLNNIVAVTGDGTNDAPALKKSDVGFAMGIRGTDIAKEASDIILLNDSFSSIVTAIKFGRNVYDCIRKFLQFQLTTNIVAVFITLIGGIVLNDSPLNSIQMLWVNLIMDSFASLALATEYPTNEILERKPYPKEESILTSFMIINIITQTIFQIVVLLFIIFYGDFLFMVESDRDLSHYEWPDNKGYHFTIFFNIFVFMQVFNSINARKLRKSEVDVFDGIFDNLLYIFIQLFIIIGQIFMVQIGGRALRTRPLSISQHFFCLLIASGGLVVCFAIKNIKFEVKGEGEEADTGANNNSSKRGSLRKGNNIDRSKSFTQNIQRTPSLSVTGHNVDNFRLKSKNYILKTE